MKERFLEENEKYQEPLLSKEAGLDYNTVKNVIFDRQILEELMGQLPTEDFCINNRRVRSMIGLRERKRFLFREEILGENCSKILFLKEAGGVPEKGVVIDNLTLGANIGFEGFVSRKAVEKFIQRFIVEAAGCERFFRQGDK